MLVIYFSSLTVAMVSGTDAFLHSWDELRAFAFLPFACAVSCQLSLCHQGFSHQLYLHSWEYCLWCAGHGHTVSTLSVLTITRFLFFFRSTKVFPSLRSRAIMRYAPPLSSFVLLGLQDSFVLRDLVRSFELECPRRPSDPPACDLV